MVEVTCAIIKDGGKVLITQRSSTMPHALKWEFPGGKLRVGESPEKCITREIREELGIHVRVECLLPSVVHQYDYITIKLIPFVCSIQAGSIVLKEHKCFRWIEIDQLENVDWLEADLRIVKKVKDMKLSEC